MVRALPGTLLLLAVALVARAQPAQAPQPPIVVKLPVRAAAKQPRALKYQLLPDPFDVVPGNAAPFWLRSGQSAAHVKRRFTDAEYKWLNSDETALKDLPRDKVRTLLDEYRSPLRLAEEAARRDHCDWELPPLTLQTMDALPLDEIQANREIANLLSLRARLELAEGKLDSALHTIQVEMSLARDVGNGPTLIHNLVGIAIGMITLGRVEEVIQQPGAPNLYWALTELPQPFFDLRKSMRYELNNLFRSFPSLREFSKGPMTAEQAQRTFEEVQDALCKIAEKGPGLPGWAKRFSTAALVASEHASAKRYLVEDGRAADQVEAMPPVQAVVLAKLDQYDRERDDLLKCYDLPLWEARAGLEQFDKRLKAERAAVAGSSVLDGKWIFQLLGPAALKTFGAELRIDRAIAGLRCAEAVRLYAATHDGKLPAALKDITEVPLPLDPAWGKGFDELYKPSGEPAVLEVPALSSPAVSIGRVYQFVPAQ